MSSVDPEYSGDRAIRDHRWFEKQQQKADPVLPRKQFESSARDYNNHWRQNYTGEQPVVIFEGKGEEEEKDEKQAPPPAVVRSSAVVIDGGQSVAPSVIYETSSSSALRYDGGLNSHRQNHLHQSVVAIVSSNKSNLHQSQSQLNQQQSDYNRSHQLQAETGSSSGHIKYPPPQKASTAVAAAATTKRKRETGN